MIEKDFVVTKSSQLHINQIMRLQICYDHIVKCSEYAAIAHKEQFRKDKKTPYIVHPARVAMLVAQSKISSTETICAAWLHDVIEDCSEDSVGQIVKNHEDGLHDFLTLTFDIREITDVMDMVIDLTKDPDFDRDKSVRNKIYYQHLNKTGRDASIIIKLCDRIDNVLTVQCFSPDGQKYYLKDTVTMIRILGQRAKQIDGDVLGILKTVLRNQSKMCGVSIKEM